MKLSTVMNQSLSYNHEGKEAFHKVARAALRKLAKELGLEKDQYEIRSNKAGIAVSGEVTLHTDPVVRINLNATDWSVVGLYVQVSQSCLGRGREVMFRTCTSRKDYTGGTNHFASAADLEDVRAFVHQKIRRLVN